MRTVYPLFSMLVLVLAAAPAGATTVSYNVSLGTSGFVSHPAGPFSLNLQFVDGSGLSDGNNSVTVWNFSGATPGGSPTLAGGASGSLAGGVTLTDSSFFNAFTQMFTPGASMSFTLSLTTLLDAGGTPDEFSLAILDSTGSEVPTTAFSTYGTDSILIIDIVGASPDAKAFGGDGSRAPVAGGPPIAFAAPVLAGTGAVPEPATAGVALVALAGFGVWRRKRGYSRMQTSGRLR